VPRLDRLIVLILAGWLAAAPAPARAQQAERAELDAIQEELSERADRQRALAQQAEAAGREAEALSRRLSALASDIQAAEEKIALLENEVSALTAVEAEKRSALEADRDRLAKTLAALQRLSQRPPQTALLAPGDAVDVVRAGRALSAVTPLLRQRAEATRRSVEDLRRVRAELAADQRALKQALAGLTDQRQDLALLLAEREAQRRRLMSQAEQEAQRIARLGNRAETLEQLISELDRQAEERERLLAEALERSAAPAPRPTERLTGLPAPNTDLPLPARGEIIQRFGQELAAGASKGLTIRTRNGAQVVVPFDGRVVFSGPFRNYGQLLIIDHGDGYHSLLAGMEQINAAVGQWVLAGEPVGVMAVKTPFTSDAASSGSPELYVELRRRGQPVDPLPWLSTGIGKVG